MSQDGVGINDLPSFKDKFVTIQIDTSDDEHTPDDFKEVTGKVIAVSNAALVIQGRSDVAMIEVGDILEIEEVLKFTNKDSLIVRELARVTGEAARQHLLDRHGMQIEKIRAMSVDTAVWTHSQLHDETHLGHVHGHREKGKPGRKPRRPGEASDANAVQIQGPVESDGSAAHVCDS